MTWTEIKKWAKDKGYDAVKDKADGQYYWAKLDDTTPTASGVARSVSKLAKAIFNHLTNDQWLKHQEEYENNKELKKISISDYGS